MNTTTEPPPLPVKKKQSRGWLYLGGGIGFLVVCTFAVIIGISIQRLAVKQQSERKALADFKNTTAVERDKMVAAMKKGETSGGGDSIARVKEQMEKSAPAMSTDNATALRALSVYLEKVQNDTKAYEASVKRLKDEKVFAFRVSDRAALAEYRNMLNDFVSTNNQLQDATQRAEELARAQLVAAKVPAATTEAVMAGFSKGAIVRQKELRIREYDRKLGNDGLAIVDLLERNWGNWEFDNSRAKLVFKNAALLQSYNRLMADMQAVSSEQKKVQEQLAEELKTIALK